MSETNDMQFINGVRVTVKDSTRNRGISGKKAEVLEKLSRICKHLGGLWTLGYFGDNDTQFLLYYDGGNASPNGIEIWMHNSYSDECYQNRPDYWKFEFSGSYPQPKHSNDAIHTHNMPRATINISDPAKAAAAIKSRLIPGITEVTAKARANVANCAKRDQDYAERIKAVADYLNTDVNQYWLERHHSEHKFPCQDAHGTHYVTVHRGDDRISYGDRFTIDELFQVMEFVKELRRQKEIEKNQNLA